jgi:hypothetical protein
MEKLASAKTRKVCFIAAAAESFRLVRREAHARKPR